jgi:hypothetical protein
LGLARIHEQTLIALVPQSYRAGNGTIKRAQEAGL